MKKALMGIVFSAILYFVGCMAVRAAAGAIADSKNPHDSASAGRLAGVAAVARYRDFIIGGAVLLGAAISMLELRPRTR